MYCHKILLKLGNIDYLIALKFDWPPTTVRFENDHTILGTNVAAWKLCDILRLDTLFDVEMGLLTH